MSRKQCLYLFFVAFFLELSFVKAEVSEKKTSEVSFEKIKKVLKSDLLEKEAAEYQKKKEQEKKSILKKETKKYSYPDDDNMWGFLSEYWLVKNAPILKWDFEKPSYGIAEAFEGFLEKMGHYEVKFKLILLNSTNVSHFALPAKKGEYIFLLSVPFIRTLDLSKLQISLLLYEDFLRIQKRFFHERVTTKGLSKIMGVGVKTKKEMKIDFLKDVLKKYDQIIFEKGFNFQQQYEVTNLLGVYLKNDMKLWKNYISMLKKIDELVKYNLMYRYMLKIYPSAELQLNWLKPKIPKAI